MRSFVILALFLICLAYSSKANLKQKLKIQRLKKALVIMHPINTASPIRVNRKDLKKMNKDQVKNLIKKMDNKGFKPLYLYKDVTQIKETIIPYLAFVKSKKHSDQNKKSQKINKKQ